MKTLNLNVVNHKIVSIGVIIIDLKVEILDRAGNFITGTGVNLAYTLGQLDMGSLFSDVEGVLINILGSPEVDNFCKSMVDLQSELIELIKKG